MVGPGAVIDFSGAALTSGYCFYGYHGSTGQSNVTLDGLEVKNCAGIAVKDGDNWTNRNLYLHDSLIGLDGSCDGCRILHNAEYGVTGAETVSNTELGFNGGTPDSGGSTGGSKTVQLANSYWINDYVHDNLGPGVWCDTCWSGSTFVIQGGRYIHNKTAGIDFEASLGTMTVSGVTASDNGYDAIGQSCYYGADIITTDSPGVSVTGSTVDASAGENAICAANPVRGAGDPTTVTPFTVSGNTITLAGASLEGEAGDHGGTATITTCNNALTSVCFSNNTYHTDGGSHYSLAGTYPMTWAQWTGLGEDQTLLFDDEFNGTSVDLTKWTPSWYNGTNISHSASNGNVLNCWDPKHITFPGDGAAHLVLSNTACTTSANEQFSWTGAGMESDTHFTAPTAGYREDVRAKVPLVSWPGVWSAQHPWPQAGEFDIAEGLSGGAYWHTHYGITGTDTSVGGLMSNDGNWHIYTAIVTPGAACSGGTMVQTTYQVDGVTKGSSNVCLAWAGQYLILSMDGGNGQSWMAPTQATELDIDWLRVSA